MKSINFAVLDLAVKAVRERDQRLAEIEHGNHSKSIFLYSYQREEIIHLARRADDKLQQAIHQALYSETDTALSILLEKFAMTRIKIDEDTLFADMLLVASHMRTPRQSFTLAQLHSIFIDWNDYLGNITMPLRDEQMYEHLALLADLTLYKIKVGYITLWERHWDDDVRDDSSLEDRMLNYEEALFLIDSYDARDELFALIKERNPQSIAFLKELMETPSTSLMSGVL